MYPTISEFLKSVGIYLPLPIQTFGFFVALAFVAAAYTVSRELKRKGSEGLIPIQIRKVILGKPASLWDYFLNGLIGFFLGYKLVLILTDYMAFVSDPQGHILSLEGNFLGGLGGGILLVYLRYREDKAQRLEKPIEKDQTVKPADHLGNLIMRAVVGGLIGAKVFHNLENMDELISDPVGSLLSFSGLTFYGGLIVAAILIIRYARKNGIEALTISDAIVPGLMLAYGIGRIGCHVSGDGDWGIINSAYISSPDGKVKAAGRNDFADTSYAYLPYYKYSFEGFKDIEKIEDIPHAKINAPDFLPAWTVAYSFPHNVNNEGIPLFKNNNGKWQRLDNERWNRKLPIPVFPTSLYEALAAISLFFVLWGIRKRIKTAGILTAFFMIFNGLERFFIEKIRVNTEYNMLGGGVSQAEIISALLFFFGIFLMVFQYKAKAKTNQ